MRIALWESTVNNKVECRLHIVQHAPSEHIIAKLDKMRSLLVKIVEAGRPPPLTTMIAKRALPGNTVMHHVKIVLQVDSLDKQQIPVQIAMLVHTLHWEHQNCEYTVTTCPAGTYATSTAACEQCPSGYYSQTGQSCTGCESGKFSSAGQSHCNPPTQKTSGKCTIPLTTADICLEAAQALILTGIQSSLYGTSRSATDVPGCTYDSFWAEYGIGMKFNINPDSTGDCTQGKTCICLKPVCTCLNGTPESEACTEDGAEHCKTCDDGFDLDENNACVDIDDCASDPCQNGGTCTDKVNAFSCACASGYEGDTCETDIDECATSPTSPTSPCDANADCANNVGSYTCTCMDGYHGSGESCTDWGGTCDNGELIAQSSRTQDDHCGKCDSGFGRNTTYQCEACSDTDYKYSTGFDPSACVDHVECEAGQGSNYDQLYDPSTEQSVCVTCGQGTFSAGPKPRSLVILVAIPNIKRKLVKTNVMRVLRLVALDIMKQQLVR